MIGLNNGSGAKGVALKIMDHLGQAVILGKTYKVSGYQGGAGDFEIPLNASYVRLPGKALEAGSANAEAIFIMSYL
ncbi:Fimbrial protein [compost metagenome]